jgi:glucokinase
VPSSFLFISIGTGISSCLVLNGHPFAGHRGNALVLASSDRDGVNPERVASGPGIAARYSELSGRSTIQSEDIVAQSTDLIAFDVVEAATRTIAVNIALAIDILDPERVVLGGGLGSAPGMYRDALIPAIRSRIWSEETRALPIVPAELESNAGIIGAALKAMNAAKESILEGTAT